MSLLSALCKIFVWILKVFKLVVKAIAEAIKVVLTAVVDVLDTLLDSVSESIFGGGLGKTVFWGFLAFGVYMFLTKDEDRSDGVSQTPVG